MVKLTIGSLTFSDGQRFAHDLRYQINRGFQEKLVKAVEATGEITCVPGEIAWTPELARSDGRRLAAAGVEAF